MAGSICKEVSGESGMSKVYCNFSRAVGSWPLLVIVGRDMLYAAHAHHLREEKRCPYVRASYAEVMR